MANLGGEAEREEERRRGPREEHGLEDIVHEIQTGVNTQDAMEQLVQIISPWVESEVRAHLRGQRLRLIGLEDACQEVLCRVLWKIKTVEFRGTGAFVAWISWLSKTTLRALIDRMEAQKRGGGHIITEDLEVIAGRVWANTRDHDELDLIEKVKHLLATLPALQITVFDAVMLRGMTRREVATRLDMSEQKVRRLLGKALYHIRTQWYASPERPQ